MVWKVALVLALLTTPALAQIQSRPTDPPLVTAVNESWYQRGEPIQFAGDVYFPAGPTVFFDGNVMVRTGHYNGVPLYANTTIEPYSVVLVPVGRGLMEPYERRRRGDIAGTTGSRAPSFPVVVGSSAGTVVRQAGVSPTAPPLPTGAISVYTPEGSVAGTTGTVTPPAPARISSAPVGTTGRGVSRRASDAAIVSLLRPESNDGVWIMYEGEKWVSAGPAVAMGTAAFASVGDYAGFPVYTSASRPDVIYIQTGAGVLAPYKRKR